MPMYQRKQELADAKVSRTSISGLIHINTNVSAYRTYFLATQYRRRCTSSVAEDSHPTSTVWLINNE